MIEELVVLGHVKIRRTSLERWLNAVANGRTSV